jgi:hypothetical protein
MRDPWEHLFQAGIVVSAVGLAMVVYGSTPFGAKPDHHAHKNDIVVLSPVSNTVAAEIKPGGECIPGAFPRPGHEFTILYLPNASDDPCARSTWAVPPSRSQLTETK